MLGIYIKRRGAGASLPLSAKGVGADAAVAMVHAFHAVKNDQQAIKRTRGLKRTRYREEPIVIIWIQVGIRLCERGDGVVEIILEEQKLSFNVECRVCLHSQSCPPK